MEKELKHVIYKLTSPSNKVYIGRTNDFDGRMASHKYNSKKGIEFTIYSAINKYGWENFTKEIIFECKGEEEAAYMEAKFIVEYDSVRLGYNSTYNTVAGGDHWAGKRNTKKYKEYLKKMSHIVSGEKNPMFGKKHKDETKQKQKEKAKGRFSLPWFIERYGEIEGDKKYQARCEFLSNRKMIRDSAGNFTKRV